MFLEALIGWLVPSPLAKVQERVRPNPYAPDVGRAHWQAAIHQAIRPGVVAGIRGGLSGRSGSEAAYAEGQRTPNVLVQGLSAHALAPAWFVANYGKPPTDGAYNRRPVLLGPEWGVQQRGTPMIRATSTLPPMSRTPLPRQMAAAYAATRPNALRLEDIFNEADR